MTASGIFALTGKGGMGYIGTIRNEILVVSYRRELNYCVLLESSEILSLRKELVDGLEIA